MVLFLMFVDINPDGEATTLILPDSEDVLQLPGGEGTPTTTPAPGTSPPEVMLLPANSDTELGVTAIPCPAAAVPPFPSATAEGVQNEV